MADPDSAAVALVGQAELADIRALKIHGEVVDFVIADSQNNVNLRKLTARVNHDEDSRALFYTFSFAIDCTEGDDEARLGTKIDLEFGAAFKLSDDAVITPDAVGAFGHLGRLHGGISICQGNRHVTAIAPRFCSRYDEANTSRRLRHSEAMILVGAGVLGGASFPLNRQPQSA